tara:strand:+ start:957 stop:1517 length:561 start_codon:yes stop_codon:yes gene_type:complete
MSLLACLLMSVTLLHPAQESLAELRFNEKTQQVEVALRVSIADEQQLLRSVSKSSVEDLVTEPEELQNAALTVLRKRLRFGTQSEVTAAKQSPEIAHAYHWVGRQSEGGHVWWYFAVTGTPATVTHLRCTLFAMPDSAASQSRSATAHDHLHADPLSTFLVLRSNQIGEPNSFTTTNKKPVHRIHW